MRHLLAAVGGALALVLAVLGTQVGVAFHGLLSAGAQTSEPAPGFTAEPDAGHPGATIAVSGGGCTDAAGSEVHVKFTSGPPEHRSFGGVFIPADDEGRWSGEIRVPLELDPGEFQLTASCIRADGTAFPYEPQRFEVVAADVTTTVAGEDPDGADGTGGTDGPDGPDGPGGDGGEVPGDGAGGEEGEGARGVAGDLAETGFANGSLVALGVGFVVLGWLCVLAAGVERSRARAPAG